MSRSISSRAKKRVQEEETDEEKELLPPHLDESAKKRAALGGKHQARRVRIEYQQIEVRGFRNKI